jgi:hypothetical protein
VGRDAFDGEGSGYAHLFRVFVGLVVEVFGVGFGGYGGVDFFLAGDALDPPLGVGLDGGCGPVGVGFAGDLPFFPVLVRRVVEGLVQRVAEGFEEGLELVPDDVDLGVVGDGFEGDVGDAFVDEALADLVVSGADGDGLAGDFGFFGVPVRLANLVE